MEYARCWLQVQPMPGQRKSVIFFDWDGTLADSMPLCLEHLRRTLADLGLPPKTNAEMACCNGPTYEESAAVLGIPDDRAAEYLQVRQREELACVQDWQRLFPGVREMLTELAPLADLVVVSNGLAEYVRVSMETVGIAEVFTRVQSRIPGKTKVQVLRTVLDEMQPLRCVMVGDRRGDILAGRENGVRTIAACYGYGQPEEWAVADQQAYSVKQLREQLLDFIQRGE